MEARRLGRLPPPAIYSKDGKPLLSWRVRILPFIEYRDLYNEFHLDEPWDSEHNQKLIAKMPSGFRSPLTGDLGGRTTYLLPVGPDCIFFDNQGTSPDEITDGAADTIMLVEADADHAVPWTKPEDLPIDKQFPAAGLVQRRRGEGEGTFHVQSADGRDHWIPSDTDPATLWSLFTRRR